MKDTAAWSEYCKSLAPALIQACTMAPVSTGPLALVRELGHTAPDWPFRHAVCRGGWHRLGGLIDASGKRLTDSLESWAETELATRQGDLGWLAEDYAGQKLLATRLIGRTHYLVAPAGDGPADFLQLEIEELQEIASHTLFADGEPATLDELLDPQLPANSGRPLGLPCYTFRRISHIGAFLARMRVKRPEPAPIHRMVEDWAASSAGHTSDFCNHWVLAMSEHQDRFLQSVFRAKPMAALEGQPPLFHGEPGQVNAALRTALMAYDRACGYPMAWFFHMLVTHAVPHWVAQTVIEDAQAGFEYLPERDLAVVRNWLHRPYAL